MDNPELNRTNTMINSIQALKTKARKAIKKIQNMAYKYAEGNEIFDDHNFQKPDEG